MFLSDINLHIYVSSGYDVHVMSTKKWYYADPPNDFSPSDFSPNDFSPKGKLRLGYVG
jgi:hypothetical protein